MTPAEATTAAGEAAEAIRSLNHHTRAGTVAFDVSEVYDLLGELALMMSRLPQLLRQLEDVLDDLIEHDEIVIVDGVNRGDPVAVAAICGHWIASAAGAAHDLAHHIDAAHQTLTWAAPTP
ncbi:hypothetical protein KV100_12710 [Mumia sp. zg.B21]|uniref:hypothetical protein n=1 Tax=Mumia sp. zg.B21 TaxID=2855447 RepID=UPI001C6EA72E|nr:hypothetical protein [Mumia sp. zg.B21]MBW9210515.1 hypothetical protein [Mumia sp. zg.B21]